jgi:prepilin-type N-terminal cleavage/methylation domain-containing protein/prepilin-type processing-associated H-X9-DG protein
VFRLARGPPLAAEVTMTIKHGYRAGFTLIELLVVIAIIAVLIGLLMPAVQASREQARRASCTNNLKQMGLALATYGMALGGLPPGFVSTWDNFLQKEAGPGWGWGSMILPQLEQQPLFDAINFSVAMQQPDNATVRLQRLAVYVCPSDSMPRTWTASEGVTWIYAGKVYSQSLPICDVASSNYIGVFGIGEPGVDGEGVFCRNSFFRPSDITDGLSNTLCVGERSINLNAGRGQSTWVGSVPGATLWSCAPDPYDPDGGVCRKEDGSGMTLGHTGEGHGPGDPWGDVNQFLSRHGRGSFFLFCDGHVRFLNNSMDYKLYKALSTRAWGEVISGDY